jgi:hypothetical protein
MDWSRQTLTFASDAKAKVAARTVAAALGVRLKKTTSRQLGTSFHTEDWHDAAAESVSVMETADERRLLGTLPAAPPSRAELPSEPTIVFIQETSRADAIIEALTGAGLRLVHREPCPPAYVQEADAAWRRLLPELRSAGWEVEVTGHAAPVQLEGKVPSGDRFYYRCRWDTCSLDIGGDDPADSPEWTGEQVIDGEYAASHLNPEDAVRILLDLHAGWAREVSSR